MNVSPPPPSKKTNNTTCRKQKVLMSCCKFWIYPVAVITKFTTWQLSLNSIQNLQHDTITKKVNKIAKKKLPFILLKANKRMKWNINDVNVHVWLKNKSCDDKLKNIEKSLYSLYGSQESYIDEFSTNTYDTDVCIRRNLQ